MGISPLTKKAQGQFSTFKFSEGSAYFSQSIHRALRSILSVRALQVTLQTTLKNVVHHQTTISFIFMPSSRITALSKQLAPCLCSSAYQFKGTFARRKKSPCGRSTASKTVSYTMPSSTLYYTLLCLSSTSSTKAFDYSLADCTAAKSVASLKNQGSSFVRPTLEFQYLARLDTL